MAYLLDCLSGGPVAGGVGVAWVGTHRIRLIGAILAGVTLPGGVRTEQESAPFHGALSTTLYIMESRHYIGWRDCSRPEEGTMAILGSREVQPEGRPDA